MLIDKDGFITQISKVQPQDHQDWQKILVPQNELSNFGSFFFSYRVVDNALLSPDNLPIMSLEDISNKVKDLETSKTNDSQNDLKQKNLNSQIQMAISELTVQIMQGGQK
ncbi:hypothetical protein IV37_GL000200 [Fructilactobacillus fructivorans]|nr:hypothetical protein IV37_GL000200 [Fructilactobacillus fructivorans]